MISCFRAHPTLQTHAMTTSQIIRHTLPNGFTVLLEENHSAPVISLNVLVKVGSAMEENAHAGICHFIEHMLFKGTPTRAVGAIARDVEAAGGEINAYTSFDHTVYYINMASRYAKTGLEILADAVLHPLFDHSETTREAEVICEEIRRGNDNPQHYLMEKTFEHIYGTHPYGRPIIGFDHTVKSFTGADLQAFWERWYVGPNMALVVVGDFIATEMLEEITQLFGAARSTPPPTRPELAVPLAIGGPLFYQERLDIESHYFALAFPIPTIGAPEIPTIDVLSHLLGSAESSRLERVIKEERQLVQSIYTYAFTARGTGLFIIGGMAQGKKMAQVIPAIWREVERFSAPHNVQAAELERAKLNICSSEIYERETVGGQAGKHAYFLSTVNDHTFETRYYAQVGTTTTDDVQRLASSLLQPKDCVCTWVAPTKAKAVAPATVTSWCKRNDVVKNIAIVRSGRGDFTPTTFTLDNGMRCVVRPDHRLPLLSIQAMMFGGLRAETARVSGISALLSQTLTKGTLARDATSIAEAADAIGGGVSAGAGKNTFMLRGEFLSSKLPEGLSLFAETLNTPAFAVDEVEKEKAQQLEAIRNQEDNLAAIAMKAFSKALYGAHPYALPMLGEPATVKRLSPKLLRAFYASLAKPSNIVVSLAGDLDPAQAKILLNRYFRGGGKSKPGAVKSLRMAAVKPQTITLHRPGKQQAHIFYGVRGTTVHAKDRYAFSVLHQILSGQGGRLFLELRDKMSLAYSVSASLQIGIEPGFFAVYIGTDPSKVETALGGIHSELAKLVAAPVTAEELERAQQHLVGTYELDLQRNSSLASLYGMNALYSIPLDDVRRYPDNILKITAADILKIAKKYIKPNEAVCAIVSPGK